MRSLSTHTNLAPVPFQLLGRRPTLPSGPEWLFERKFDGYRAQIVSRGREIRVFTRGHQDWTHRVPHIVAAAGELGRDFALDGEICATTDDGRTALSWLSDPASHSARIVFHAFDLLSLDRLPLNERPLLQRKELLSDLFRGGWGLRTWVGKAGPNTSKIDRGQWWMRCGFL